MTRPRRSVRPLASLALGAVLASCQQAASPAATAPPVSAPASAVEAPAAAANRRDFSPTPTTVSYLEPRPGSCGWIKEDAVTHQRLAVASLPGDCQGGRVALTADGRRGAVWFKPAGSPATSRLVTVDLSSGATASLPPLPDTRDVGFDPAGRLVALTVQELTSAEIAKHQALVDGLLVPLRPINVGKPVLVHAFFWSGAAWKRFETAASNDEGEEAVGVYQLDAAQNLAYRSAEVLSLRAQGDLENDAALLAKLAHFAPQASAQHGQWIRFGAGNTRFVLWEDNTDLPYSTGLAAFVSSAGEPQRPANWPNTERDSVSYVWHGEALLASKDRAGSQPRLYLSGKPLWSSDRALAATFWPTGR